MERATIKATTKNLVTLSEIINSEWQRYEESKELTYALDELIIRQKGNMWDVSAELKDEHTGVSAVEFSKEIKEETSEEIGKIIYNLFRDADKGCGFAASTVALSLDNLSKVNSILAEEVNIYGYYNESYISEAYASYRIDEKTERPCWRILVEIEDALTYERASAEFFIFIEMRSDEVVNLIRQNIRALHSQVMDKREEFLGEEDEEE